MPEDDRIHDRSRDGREPFDVFVRRVVPDFADPILVEFRSVREALEEAERHAYGEPADTRRKQYEAIKRQEAQLEALRDRVRQADAAVALIEDMLNRYGRKLTPIRVRAMLHDARLARAALSAGEEGGRTL